MAEKLAAFKAQRASLSGGVMSDTRRSSSVRMSVGLLKPSAPSSGTESGSENRNPNRQHSTTPVAVRRRSGIVSASPQRLASPVLSRVSAEWSFSDCRQSPSPSACSEANSDDSYMTAFERPASRSSSISSNKSDDSARISLHQAAQKFKLARRSGSLCSISSVSSAPSSSPGELHASDDKSPIMHPRASPVRLTSPVVASTCKSSATQAKGVGSGEEAMKLFREQTAALEVRLDAALSAQASAQQLSQEASERALLAEQDVQAHRFLNSILEQQLSQAADALQSERFDNDERSAASKRHKAEVRRLQAERDEHHERATAMIQQMTEQMAQLQAYAMERIGKLEEELLEEQSRSGALESELAVVKAAAAAAAAASAAVTDGTGRSKRSAGNKAAAVGGDGAGRARKGRRKPKVEEDEQDESGSLTE